jgi:hypothetical protein
MGEACGARRVCIEANNREKCFEYCPLKRGDILYSAVLKTKSIALHGAETRTLREIDQRHLESSEIWCWRRIENIRPIL